MTIPAKLNEFNHAEDPAHVQRERRLVRRGAGVPAASTLGVPVRQAAAGATQGAGTRS